MLSYFFSQLASSQFRNTAGSIKLHHFQPSAAVGRSPIDSIPQTSDCFAELQNDILKLYLAE